MLTLIKKFSQDRSGAAAVEYGLLVALIAAVIIGTVAVLGTQISGAFASVVNALKPAVGG